MRPATKHSLAGAVGLLRAALRLLEGELCPDPGSNSLPIRNDLLPATRRKGAGENVDEPPRFPQLGRMVITPAPPGVVVVPLVLEKGDALSPLSPPAWRSLGPVELSRVPVPHEYLQLGAETLCVRTVRHLSGDVAAELHCERLPALQAKGETAATLAEVSERAR